MRVLRRQRKRPTGVTFEHAAVYLPADPVIVEAGAANGEDAVRLAGLFPEGRVHAFEPEPASFAALTAATERLRNVTCWPVALGPTDGDTVLHVSSGPYGPTSSSVLAAKDHLVEMPFVKFDQDIEVRQLTLASWAREANVDRVDMLALDLQGYEHQVLAASPELVSEATVILAEVYANEKFAGCATVTELQRLLAELGFVVLETNMQWRNAGDLIAVTRRVFE